MIDAEASREYDMTARKWPTARGNGVQYGLRLNLNIKKKHGTWKVEPPITDHPARSCGAQCDTWAQTQGVDCNTVPK